MYQEHRDHEAIMLSKIPDLARMLPMMNAQQQRKLGTFLGAEEDYLVYGMPERAVIILGPPRAGKTSGIIVPQILSAPGPVVSTSTKLDVFQATAMARGCHGRVWIYDPTGTEAIPSGATSLSWSPVWGAEDWDTAFATGRAMVETANPGKGVESADYWNKRAGTLLATLLHLAALAKVPMRQVTRWVSQRNAELLHETLIAAGGSEIAQDLMASVVVTPDREQGGIWGACEAALGAYYTEAALKSCENPNFDPNHFILPRNTGTIYQDFDTLYITAPSDKQRLVAPLVVSLIEAIRRAAIEAARWKPLPLPLSFILDEAANIAPIPSLPNIVADAGGQGIRIVAAFQDLSQARERWQDRAKGFLTLFGERLILAGILDGETLKLIRMVMGDYDRTLMSHGQTFGTTHGTSRTWTKHRQAVLPESAIYNGPGPGAMWYIPNYAMPLFLTPWYEAPPWPSFLCSAIEMYGGKPLPIPVLTSEAFTNDIPGLAQRYKTACYWQEQAMQRADNPELDDDNTRLRPSEDDFDDDTLMTPPSY